MVIQSRIWIFLQLLNNLNLTTSNSVHNLDLGFSLPKTIFRTKICGSGLGKHPRNLGPLPYFSNGFKFDTELRIGFGRSLSKTTKTQIGGHLCSTPKTLGPSWWWGNSDRSGNKTANINVKNAVYTPFNSNMTHLKLQKSQKVTLLNSTSSSSYVVIIELIVRLLQCGHGDRCITLTYKCLHDLAPDYLTCPCVRIATGDGRPWLRSSDDH